MDNNGRTRAFFPSENTPQIAGSTLKGQSDKRKTKLVFNSSVASDRESFMRSNRQGEIRRGHS